MIWLRVGLRRSEKPQPWALSRIDRRRAGVARQRDATVSGLTERRWYHLVRRQQILVLRCHGLAMCLQQPADLRTPPQRVVGHATQIHERVPGHRDTARSVSVSRRRKRDTSRDEKYHSEC
jgi:hypothetical protein